MTTPSPPRSRRNQLGRIGEVVAARHLTQRAGMTLLDRNWRCRHGEIDLVLRDQDVLVVCEVKTRTSVEFGHPVEQVSAAKAARLKVLAAAWCEAHDLHPSDIRIDIVGVILPPRSGGSAPAEIVHVRGIGW